MVPSFPLVSAPSGGREGGGERDVYECTPHSSNIEVLMQPGCYFWGSCFDTWYGFKDPKLVNSRSFEMNRQHAYRVSSFYVGWMDGWMVPSSPLISTLSCLGMRWRGERGNHRIWVYFSLSNKEASIRPRCFLGKVVLTTRNGFKEPKLIYSRSFEINRQQIYRVSRFYVGWMDGWCPPLLSTMLLRERESWFFKTKFWTSSFQRPNPSISSSLQYKGGWVGGNVHKTLPIQ